MAGEGAVQLLNLQRQGAQLGHQNMLQGIQAFADLARNARMKDLLARFADAHVASPQQFREFARDNNVTMPEANALVGFMEKQRQANLKQQIYQPTDYGIVNTVTGEVPTPMDPAMTFGRQGTGVMGKYSRNVLRDPDPEPLKFKAFGQDSSGIMEEGTGFVAREPGVKGDIYTIKNQDGSWQEVQVMNDLEKQKYEALAERFPDRVKRGKKEFAPSSGNAAQAPDTYYNMTDGSVITKPKGTILTPEEQSKFVTESTYNSYVMAEREGLGDVARELISKSQQATKSLLKLQELKGIIDKEPDSPTKNKMITNMRNQEAALQRDIATYETSLKNLRSGIKERVFNRGEEPRQEKLPLRKFTPTPEQKSELLELEKTYDRKTALQMLYNKYSGDQQ